MVGCSKKGRALKYTAFAKAVYFKARPFKLVMYKTQGIIIKRKNLGEYDRLLTVYTKEFGKILIKAKSIRKNQSKLRGHLELFLFTHLMIAPGKGFDIITGAETIESFPYLHKNLSYLTAIYYLSELIDKLITNPEQDEEIWKLFYSTFQQLNQEDKDIKPIINNFENQLLDFLGYGKQENFLSFVESMINDIIKTYPFLISNQL